jgi:thioesterase domain-containing protein/acyl carrier protein
MAHTFQDMPVVSVATDEVEDECIDTTSETDIYAMPATQGQVRFWSLDQLNPGNPALNMPLMWRCTGNLNLNAMVQAFNLCVRRHEALRTTFELADGQLSQIIHPSPAVQIPLMDLSGLEGELRRLEADRLTREHAAIRMNLKQGPLLTLKILRFDATHHLLLVTMHHIICDGISLGILLRDMAEFYRALVTHSESVLPELPVQFADFAVWQKDWLKSDEPAESLAFWRQSLGNDLPRMGLPHDPDAVAVLDERRVTWTGDIETLLIPLDLQARAHAFCVRENATLNILLFSIFAALLHRLTGQYDLVIGSPCANRTEETEEVVGLFMNIQVMRLRLKQDDTFRSLLGQVQDWTLGAYENQALPFENLIHDDHFAQERNAFDIPIFFLYQKSFMVTHQVGGLEIVPVRSESPGAVFEMFFAIVDRVEEGPRLQLEYNPRYFKVPTIQRYLNTYIGLLDAALSSPEANIHELELAVFSDSEVIAPVAAPSPIDSTHGHSHFADEESYFPPSDGLESQIADIWQRTLNIPQISVRTNFFSLGAGSLAALRLITKMNRVFGMELGLASLISAATVESIAELIRKRLAPNTSSSLVPLQPRGTNPPLYIVHGVGGNVVNFYGLALRMGAEQPVYGIQSQALVANQPALLHLKDMATHYIEDIRRVQPHGPYKLLGYSFGGTVVLEMAHQLRRMGEEVAMLGMIDSKSKDYEEALSRLTTMQTRINRRVNRFKGNAGRLAWQDRAKYIWEKITTRAIRFACMAAANLNIRRVPAFMSSAYDINYVAVLNYRLRSYDGKLVLFRASEQDAANGPYDLGWGPIFHQGVQIHDLTGDHERIFLEPNIDRLAERLRESLNAS